MPASKIIRRAAVIGACLLASACVETDKTSLALSGSSSLATETASSNTPDLGSPQPKHAAYRCDGGATLMIDNRVTTVSLVDPDGETLELPAAPASQRSRYGQTPYALVLDGNEALYMKSGKEPVICRR
ncbi:hypothetical protein QBK99_18610 [Corticibacterium sp. UT-5YL-CI-8]|nr:hypothetical protein [Tianweitania sp. UT-5YL-CI-8]